MPVLLAVIRQAAEAASASDGFLHGVPPWLVVLAGTVLIAALLWLFGRLLRLLVWVLLILVLVGGAFTAARMLLGAA